ncbi:hypothetical protein PS15p_211836 [Mucor circinelloides]
MAPTPLDVKLEIALDGKQLKYYPGDQVEGKVFLTANQNYSLRNFRLAWTGRIQVQPIQSNKDSRIYFDECWKLGSKLTKSPSKTPKGSSNVPFYFTDLVLVHQDGQEPKVELQKNKTLGLTFKVNVPNDRPLPSCTEAGISPNKIIYLLEAFIDDQKQRQGNANEKPVFFAQKTVPVFEAIYTRTPEMTTPQRAEQVFMVSLFAEEKEFTSAMRVTLPCRGSQPGIAIPVSISIWNNMEFTRRQGISISLFRVNHVLANGRAYTSQGEKVHRVVTDLNITSDNSSNSNQKVQTVRVGLPIPRGTMPTVSLEQSQLLSVSYFIRVQVFAQEGVYTTSEGTKSQFMTVDLPFVIGTLASPDNNTSSPTLSNNNASSPTLTNRSVSPTTSPMSSPRSTYTSLSSIFTPQQQTAVSPQLQSQSRQPQQSSDTGSTNERTTEVSDTTSISTSSNQLETSNSINRKSKIMGNMFRKSSTGSSVSTTSSEEKKKKKGVFSTLRLYSSKKNSDQNNDQADTESLGSQKDDQQQQVSPAVVMTPKHNEPEPSQQQQQQQQGGIFDIFAGDDVDDDDDIPRNYSKIEQEKNSTQDHDDSTTVISSRSTPPPLPPRQVQETTTTPPPAPVASQGRFQMFPDDDSSDEEEEGQAESTIQEQASVAMTTNVMDQEIDSISDNVENLTFDERSNQQAPPQRSNVFRMFDDDDSDDEEEIVNQLTVSQERIVVLIDERVKPHHQDGNNDKPHTYNYYYKPNTMTDSSEDEHDENDLLAALARREKSI